MKRMKLRAVKQRGSHGTSKDNTREGTKAEERRCTEDTSLAKQHSGKQRCQRRQDPHQVGAAKKGLEERAAPPCQSRLALRLCPGVTGCCPPLTAQRWCPSDEYKRFHRASVSDKTTLWPGWIKIKTGPLWNHV